MNLYHKVEAAFDGMADALKAAMNVADMAGQARFALRAARVSDAFGHRLRHRPGLHGLELPA